MILLSFFFDWNLGEKINLVRKIIIVFLFYFFIFLVLKLGMDNEPCLSLLIEHFLKRSGETRFGEFLFLP